MNIDFSPERWQRVQETYAAWWAGELDRPLLAVSVQDRDPGRPEPALPYHRFVPFYDAAVPADAILDRWAYQLERTRYLGDAFPHLHANFGAGAIAAFMGLDIGCGEETVWFRCEKPVAPPELTLAPDPDNPWYRRCADFLCAAADRFEGQVQLAIPDLGGNLDILSSFRPGELLLTDLYDYPEDVKRLTWEAHEAWWWYYEAISDILKPSNPGYTCWTPLLSREPYYMLQCDFSYMIGPDMFAEFVQPELDACCRRLGNPFYHCDGPGQLPHLGHLLSIPDLKGVQWVPGAGNPGPEGWPEVYRRIREAGRLAQVVPGDPLASFDKVVEQLGSAKGLYYMAGVPPERADEAEAWLAKYGVQG